ncbi:hypothetical protein Tco_0382568 [Tanacetum coccineum]
MQTISVRSQQTSPVDSRSSRPSSYPSGFLCQQRPGISKRWRFKQTVIYDKHAYCGTSHWGPKHQHFYGFAANMSSSKDVYSRKQIIVVTRLTIMKKYDYGHLEEIEVCREDQKLYKFREGIKAMTLFDVINIAKGIRMEYLPKRKLSGLDKRRARVMVQDIDKHLYERRLMRNLEKFIGGREYRNDIRLLERTI